MPKIHHKSSFPKGCTSNRDLTLISDTEDRKVLQLLRPGSFAKLNDQPNDLPPFQVINCKGGRCLVRQQSWGANIQWEVEHHRLKSA